MYGVKILHCVSHGVMRSEDITLYESHWVMWSEDITLCESVSKAEIMWS